MRRSTTYKNNNYRSRRLAASSRDSSAFILLLLLAAFLFSHHIALSSSLLIDALRGSVGLGLLAVFWLSLRLLKNANLRASNETHTIDTMSGFDFERFIVELLPSQGYQNIRLTERYDLGLDIIAEKFGQRWGIQVKRRARKVGLSAVQQAVSGLKHYGCDRCMVISNHSYTRAARTLAQSNQCVLIDGQTLTRWAKQSWLR